MNSKNIFSSILLCLIAVFLISCSEYNKILKGSDYDLKFENVAEKKIINKELRYISKSSNEKRVIPNFLIDKHLNTVDISNLLNGLKLVGDYLDKTILKPNNLNQPISRIQFINTLK